MSEMQNSLKGGGALSDRIAALPVEKQAVVQQAVEDTAALVAEHRQAASDFFDGLIADLQVQKDERMAFYDQAAEEWPGNAEAETCAKLSAEVANE